MRSTPHHRSTSSGGRPSGDGSGRQREQDTQPGSISSSLRQPVDDPPELVVADEVQDAEQHDRHRPGEVLADEARAAGQPMIERTAWKICSGTRWWSVVSRKRRMLGSMGRVGAAGHNAAVESFFGLLQNNVLERRTWTARQALRIAIVTWIGRT